MTQPKATAAGTFEALQHQLQAAQVEAYGLIKRLEATEERIKSLQVAINAVDLGKRLVSETEPVIAVEA